MDKAFIVFGGSPELRHLRSRVLASEAGRRYVSATLAELQGDALEYWIKGGVTAVIVDLPAAPDGEQISRLLEIASVRWIFTAETIPVNFDPWSPSFEFVPVDEVNSGVVQGLDQGEKLRRFLEAAQIPAGWAEFLLDVLGDPAKVERLRAVLADRMADPGRDPLEVLLREHLAASESYLSRVFMDDVYPFYVSLCRRYCRPAVDRSQVEAAIGDAFPDAVRRMAPRPLGVHFSFLTLVSGKGGDNGR